MIEPSAHSTPLLRCWAEIDLAEFSQAADSIPWETLTLATKRIPRVHKTALGV